MGNFRLVVSLALLAIGLFKSPTSLSAQTVSGTILGIVQDQQGAVIPRANVSARNLDTGATRTATADDSGTYRIASIPAGPYEVSASGTGFKTEVRSGIIVTVGGDVSVNFSLTVGAVSEKVEVTGEASQVDTSSSAMGGLVNSATVRELPLNGRDWLQLALLQPGAIFNTGEFQPDQKRAQRGNGLAISISGGRNTDNSFRIDGLVVNDYANSGPGSALRVNMGVDAIREFSVLTNNFSAEYGRGSSGVVNAITKSGTNQIHGSAYYFHRNSALDARNFFDGPTVPPFRRHQFGGAVGGPIRKDKTFFFTNFERLTELKSLSSSVTTLSANAHSGILCATTACTSTTQVQINPKIQPYLALYPNPNGAVTGDTGIFQFAQGRLGEEKYVIGKIDHYFSAATTLSGSYSYDNSNISVPDAFDLKTAVAPARRQNVVLNLQHLFSPTLINNARVGVTRTYAGNNKDGDPRNPALADPSLGFLPGRNMGTFIITGVSGVYGGIGSGLGSSGLTLFGYTAPQVYDDLAWTKGRHSIRIGVNFERIDNNINSADKPNGTWTFNSIQRFLQATPDNVQADLPGTDGIRGMRQSLIGGYIQDDVRLRSNLTINLGLRYEMSTVLTEHHGRLSNLHNLTDAKPVIGDPYYNNPTLRNFAPRIGFAWDPFKDGKTAVRAGVGMFDIVPLPYLFLTRTPRSFPFYAGSVLPNPPASSFPNNIFPLLTASTARVAQIELNPHRSYKLQWNMNIQRQITSGMALTVGYVGSAGVHLARSVDDEDQVPPSLVTWNGANLVFPIPAAGQPIQRINPNFGLIGGTNWNGHSSYHALQTNLVQRPIKGFNYQIAYTWSKSIDNGSHTNSDSESTNTVGVPWAFDPRINRAVSDFDIPHSFVVNAQYNLPVPGAVRAHALPNAILGGWQIGGIYSRTSGGPFSVKVGKDQAFTGNSAASGNNGAQMPNFLNIPGCNPNATTGDINHYIKTECIGFPAPGVLGNFGRNTFRMPTFRDLDFSVFKNQNLWGEKLKAQLRVEMFNILNNTNLQGMSLAVFNGNGQFLSNAGTPMAPTLNQSRQIQFGLRLLF